MADNRKLARLIAGFPPYTGLRNEPALPPLDINNMLAMQSMIDGNKPFQLPDEAKAQLPPYQLPPAMPAAQPAPQAMPAPQAPPMPQPDPNAWLALGDQTRTAAFDPVRDLNDPRNVHAVNQFGFVPPGKIGPV